MEKKYIDADRLRVIINQKIKVNTEYGELNLTDRTRAGNNAQILVLQDILSILDSLQQEQPDFPTTDEQMKEFLATHPKIKVPEKYKNPDWLLKKQEQPEVDL